MNSLEHFVITSVITSFFHMLARDDQLKVSADIILAGSLFLVALWTCGSTDGSHHVFTFVHLVCLGFSAIQFGMVIYHKKFNLFWSIGSFFVILVWAISLVFESHPDLLMMAPLRMSRAWNAAAAFFKALKAVACSGASAAEGKADQREGDKEKLKPRISYEFQRSYSEALH